MKPTRLLGYAPRLALVVLAAASISPPIYAQSLGVDTPPTCAAAPAVDVVPVQAVTLDSLRLPMLHEQLERRAVVDVRAANVWGGADLLETSDIRNVASVSAPAYDPRDDYSTLIKILYHCSWIAHAATGGADLATTHRNVEVGFVEGNRFLVTEDGDFAYGRKISLTAASPVVNHHAFWKRDHPLIAIGVNTFTSVVNGVASAHNERLYRTVTPDGRPLAGRLVAARVGFRL